MNHNLDVTDTIAAQATPPGRGGVGIIRVSGPAVLTIMPAVLGKTIPARIANFCDFLTHDHHSIDQGVAIYFAAPHSFTGEEVLELQGHGGQLVMELLLQRVLELGARLAKPGEFIERAFLHHKLDLLQVEAAADLINATTKQAAKNAVRSLQGEFSHQINKLVAQLTALRVEIEATLDFAAEGELEGVTPARLAPQLNQLLEQIQHLIREAQQGLIIREGITVVLTGDTNTGKSSLLNYLSGQELAIVTDIPGTTRDVLRVSLHLDGLMVHLLDTAGLRANPDLIEAEGIRRAWEEIKKADHILLMVDATTHQNSQRLSAEFCKALPEQQRLTILYNKIDLMGAEAKIIQEQHVTCIYLSVKERRGLDLLKQHLKNSAGVDLVASGVSARSRHVEALEKAAQALQRIKDQLLTINALELIAEELRGAQHTLGEITGKVTTNELLNKIFAEFCIGK